MIKKKSQVSLNKLIYEQTIPTNVSVASTTEPRNFSIDERVDKFLIQYDRESNPQAAQNQDGGLNNAITSKSGPAGASAGFEGGDAAFPTPVSMQGALRESKKAKSLFSYLFEQEDPLGGGGDLGGDAGGGDLGGGGGDPLGGGGLGDDAGGDSPAPAAPAAPKPQINLTSFTSKIARLANNFESLVDPKTILLNRTYAYLRQSYDEKTAKEFLITMESVYQITNKTKLEKKEDMVGDVPSAVGAGDGGGGSGGA